MFELSFGFCSANNFGSGFLCEFAMSRNKIRMKMRFENVFNLSVSFLSELNIRFCLAKRVDNGSLTF